MLCMVHGYPIARTKRGLELIKRCWRLLRVALVMATNWCAKTTPRPLGMTANAVALGCRAPTVLEQRPMTDPTADAAKLLRMLEEANGVLRSAYQIATRDGLDTNWSAFKTTVENILTIQHEAGIRWNTRPQPAPPEGEPNFAREADMLLPDDFPSSADPSAPYTRGYRRQNLADEIAA